MAFWPLKKLVDHSHSAALEPARWPSLLKDISDALDGSGAILISGDRRSPEPVASPDLSETLSDYGRGGWHLRDERYLGGPLMERTGIVTDLDFTTPEQIRKSAYYQDFLGKHGLAWFAGLGFRAKGDLWCLSIQRSISQGPFQAADLDLIRSLRRPFSDAATLARQFDETRLLGMTDIIETLKHAAFVTNDQGYVIKINTAAEQLIGAMLQPREQTLAFRHGRCKDAFETMLAKALRPHDAKETCPLVVDVQDAQCNYITMQAIRIEGLGRFLFPNGAVLILLTRRPADVTFVLANTFRLTAAEIRIAKAVYDGRSVREISTMYDVKEDTVRTQLKAIYAKTDTHRQSELVTFLSRISEGRQLNTNKALLLPI